MSERAAEFVQGWVQNNVHATAYEPEGDRREAERLAFACWRATDEAGLSRAEVHAAVGDLVSHMAEQIESVNDAEVERLASKDD